MSEFLDLLSLDFMQRALVAALLTGLAAPAIGTFIVQRRLALLGDGIGHVAVTGVALGLLTGASPTWSAIVVAVLGAVLMEVIRERGHTNGDVALALLFYGGLAGGVLITGIAGQGAATLQAYLFGSLNSISFDRRRLHRDPRGGGARGLTLGLSPQLFAVASDQDFARVAGCGCAATTCSSRCWPPSASRSPCARSGLLLVSALMVVPVATSQQLARSFRTTLVGAMLVGVRGRRRRAAAERGPVLPRDVAPGPTIVLMALAMFTATWPIGVWLRRRAGCWPPFPEVDRGTHTAPPTSTPTSTARTVATRPSRHADHVDYVHDGHRHAVHGEHYDEH